MDTKLYENQEILEAYIGTPDKIEWYKKTFESYNVNGIEKFSWNWSWYSFFFPFVYLTYRKCYLEAFIIWFFQTHFFMFFSLSFPFFKPIINIIFGFLCPWLVYKKYRKSIKKIERTEKEFEIQIEMAKKLGGVNVIARNIIIIYYIILMAMLVLSIFKMIN
ncbi:hypothetical protein [Fusobacterium sp.]|jgi:hypothetical protein|nr:hypothetical protein [Fusobacterium sp.]